MAYICVHTVDIHFSESGSLKSKRRQLKGLKQELAKRFGAAVAEVDYQDLWQRSEIVVVIVCEAMDELQRRSDKLQRYIDSRYQGAARIERSLVSLEDIR